MKPQALLIMLAVVAVLAALPLAESKGKWPCCDNCGACNRKFPPECFCKDVSPSGCHPACKKCEQTTGNDGEVVYECKDYLTNFCKRTCTPSAALS